VYERQDLISEVDAFLIQLKSALDSLAKSLNPIFNLKINGWHKGKRKGSKIEESGIKIINTLNRDRKHFIVEFLKKVGTMGEMRGKHLFLKGVYKEQVLNRLIELYSKTYVLCKICNKPDTEIQREGKKKFLKCTACGAHEEIKEK
jgi:translation initiation factor 2 subunit 2